MKAHVHVMPLVVTQWKLTLSELASHLISTSRPTLQGGWHNFIYLFLLSASISLQRVPQLKHCSASPRPVKAKAKSQLRTANTQCKAANGNYTDNMINRSIYSNKL